MGYSATAAALDILPEIIAPFQKTKAQNEWTIGSESYFYEVGGENRDGAVTGSIYKMSGSKVGGFRIEPNGYITRFPSIPSSHIRKLNEPGRIPARGGNWVAGGKAKTFEDEIGYAGARVFLKEIFNEDEQPRWSNEAQSMIDEYRSEGRSACVIHKGNLHGFYADRKGVAGAKMKGKDFRDFQRAARKHKTILYRIEKDGKYWVDIDGSGRFGLAFSSYAQMRKAIPSVWKLQNVKGIGIGKGWHGQRIRHKLAALKKVKRRHFAFSRNRPITATSGRIYEMK
jgi:hypothetical protein